MEYNVLPFRLIVCKILPFWNLEICGSDGENKTELVLFGYFRRDRTRKIFQVFTSVKIDEDSDPFFLDIDKIIHLQVGTFGPNSKIRSTLRKLFQNSSKFRSLESLSLDLDDPTINCENWFANENCFPNLTRFHVTLPPSARNQDLSSWLLHAKQMWSNLRTFNFQSQLSSDRKFFLPLFEHPGFGKNLKELSFWNLQFFKEGVTKRKKIELPNIQELSEIRRTGYRDPQSHFPLEYISEAVKLKEIHFTLYNDIVQIFKEFILRHPNIQNVNLWDETIAETSTTDLSFLFDHSELKKIEFFCQPTREPNWKQWDTKTNEIFLQNIETILFSAYKRIEQMFKSVDLPNLKSLILITCQLNESLKLSQITCEKITTLSLFGVKGLTDSFFQEHNFPNLKDLSLRDHSSEDEDETPMHITGIKWNPLPKLKELRCFMCVHLSSWIFENLEMPDLQKLRLSYTKSLKGAANWKKCNTQNLRFLHLNIKQIDTESSSMDYTSSLFSSELFVQQDRFRNLIELDMVGVLFPEKKDWGEWKVRVEKLFFSLCNCTDALFQGKWVKNGIRELEISECNELEGKNWEFMSDLKNLDIDDCEKFDVANFKLNLPCNSTCNVSLFEEEEDE